MHNPLKMAERNNCEDLTDNSDDIFLRVTSSSEGGTEKIQNFCPRTSNLSKLKLKLSPLKKSL